MGTMEVKQEIGRNCLLNQRGRKKPSQRALRHLLNSLRNKCMVVLQYLDGIGFMTFPPPL
jgi:hypothetical protein